MCHDQIGFKDMCNQLKHCHVQKNELRPHTLYVVQSSQFTKVILYIHQEDGTHSSWLDGILTKLESELSTERGL